MLTISYLYTLEIYSFAKIAIISDNSTHYIINFNKSKLFQ